MKFKFAGALELLWHKVTIFQVASVEIAGAPDHPAARGLETTLKNGLVGCFRSEASSASSSVDSRVSFSAWARSALFHVFAEQVTKANGDEGIVATCWEMWMLTSVC